MCQAVHRGKGMQRKAVFDLLAGFLCHWVPPRDSNLHHSISPAVGPLQRLFCCIACVSIAAQANQLHLTRGVPGQRSHSSVLQISGKRAKLLWCVRSFACGIQTPCWARQSVCETQQSWNKKPRTFASLCNLHITVWLISSSCHNRNGSYEGFEGWKVNDLTDSPKEAMDNGNEKLFVGR